MDKKSYFSIRNGAIATVLGGLILLFIPFFRKIIIDIIDWLFSILSWIWFSLVTSYSIPGFIILLLFFFIISGIINIYNKIRGNVEIPKYKSYVEDNFYGAIWRWEWDGEIISNLW